MRVHTARFVKSAMKPSQYPTDRLPEVAFVGRSNVGKSSLLNALLNRKGLAKISATPRKTQTINFFAINEKLYFVDLPGYGFAKVPLSVKEEWGRVMLQYLMAREPLKLVVALVDARHKPSELDLEMLALLDSAEVPTLVVATKVDKLKRAERKKNLVTIRETLGLDEDAFIQPVASWSRAGVTPLWSIIDEVVLSCLSVRGLHFVVFFGDADPLCRAAEGRNADVSSDVELRAAFR